ncbi:MAG: DUF4124 domain-containing protein [Deltaproteobacteria bacterium]|nr:DUF4124 domain-containing protein [Deltaproteobacteria bacterium]
MRIFGIILISCLLSASHASAAIYQWTDGKGVLHMTDDEEKVPPEYRGKAAVIELEQGRPAAAPPPVPAVRPLSEKKDEKEELYGDHPLSWWRSAIGKQKNDLDSAEREYYQKKQFVEIFENGRRLGQTYDPDTVGLYTNHKKDLPDVEGRIRELEDGLVELRRKARYSGVPRELRGD